jgi:general secretion pathway protein G
MPHRAPHLRRSSRGFTLVEILIVVIILGILAAIVIPQFTNASTSARVSSLTAQLQTLRGQIQTFKLTHNDILPDLVTNQWNQLMQPTNITGAVDTTATGKFGPYLQSIPANPLNGFSTVAAAPGAGVGWVVIQVPYGDNLKATNQTPTLLFDESGATQPQVQ